MRMRGAGWTSPEEHGGIEGAATEVGSKPELSISRWWPVGQTLLQRD